MRQASFVRSLFLVSVAFGAATPGQCTTSWSSAAIPPGITGAGNCTTVWDPDGSGPVLVSLVVGGSNLFGGTATTPQKVLTWDTHQWRKVGDGPGNTGEVTRLAVFGGMLIASGTFTGGGTDRVAAWNGTAWQPLGAGLAFVPVALLTHNGSLVAVQSTPPAVSVWNGASWSNLPLPPTMTAANAAVSLQGLLWLGGSGPQGG